MAVRVRGSKSRSPRRAGDPAGITLADAFIQCPFRSVMGLPGADLLGQSPAAAIAAHLPDQGDPAPELLAELAGVLQAGGTVLILAAVSADRDRIKALLTAATRAPTGRA